MFTVRTDPSGEAAGAETNKDPFPLSTQPGTG